MTKTEQWIRAFGGLKPKKKTEALLHTQICKYLKAQYPRVRFHTSLDGERHTGANQGMKIRAQQWGGGFPDLMIFHKSYGHCGLAFELKKETPFKKNGELKAGDHLKQQEKWLVYLRHNGFAAGFCWDFDTAKIMIDTHLTKN